MSGTKRTLKRTPFFKRPRLISKPKASERRGVASILERIKLHEEGYVIPKSILKVIVKVNCALSDCWPVTI